MDFAGFLFSGLDFLLVIRGPGRQMYDLQSTHSMLDRTCLLQKRRFALRAEEWMLQDGKYECSFVGKGREGKG